MSASFFVEFRASSGAVWKSKWTSWAPVPNKPTVSVDVQQHWTTSTSFGVCTSGTVYVPCIYSHARSSLFCLRNVFRALMKSFVDSTHALWASFCLRLCIFCHQTWQVRVSVPLDGVKSEKHCVRSWRSRLHGRFDSVSVEKIVKHVSWFTFQKWFDKKEKRKKVNDLRRRRRRRNT